MADARFSALMRRRQRPDERTRTAHLLQLRVITQALQGCAEDCKCRIFRGVSFSPACCVLHRIAFPVVSEWYQNARGHRGFLAL